MQQEPSFAYELRRLFQSVHCARLRIEGPPGPTEAGSSVKPAKATRWTATSVLIGFETEPGDHNGLRYLWLAVDDVARVIRPASTKRDTAQG